MTSRSLRFFALAGVIAITAAACGKGSSQSTGGTTGGTGTPGTTGPTGTTATKPPQGGTFRFALQSDVGAAFDPQKEYYTISWEFMRCCLLRTLMSYNGKTTSEHGAEVFPDLASDPPTVDSTGLHWEFKLKPGIKYAPPLEGETVTSTDIVRALEREGCGECAAGGYSFYFSVIKGFDDYSSGKATSISGLTTPDDNTLDVELTQPAGDLPFRFAMPATAPIPPGPNGGTFGIATGHEKDFGRFLSATGPYMFQGADQIDYTQPADAQKPAAGYVPGKSIVLVRNPSWDPSTDDLRQANVDELDGQISSASSEDLAAKVDTGELDVVLDGVPPADQLRRYETDPNLKDQVQIHPSDAVRYMTMNLALPPFDDIHVRRAVNYAIDKDGWRKLRGGPAFGEIAGHIIVDSLEGDALKSYDPYATPNGKGDLAKAKDEMKQSKYDSNGDGVCDADPCKDVLTIIGTADPAPAQARLIAQNLAGIGITLDVKDFEPTTMYGKCNDPSTHAALCPSVGWGKDYADAFTYGPPLFRGASIGPDACCNYGLVGASSAALKKFGYQVTTVPSVDDRLAACGAEIGDARVSCWADLDKYLMETVVPWVPFLFDNDVEVVSSRVVHFSFDQFAGVMALDQIAVQG